MILTQLFKQNDYFDIKLIQQNGGDNGGKLTVMELVLILNTCLNLCIKYCNNLKHIVSTGCHAVCKNGVSQDKLHRFQEEMLNKHKLHLLHYIMHTTMGPFKDDLTEIDRILDSVSQEEFRMLNKMRDVCPTQWDEVLELFITFDKDDDLQIFEIFTTIAGFNTSV